MVWKLTETGREKLADFLLGVLRPLVAAIGLTVGAALLEGWLPAPNVGGHWYCLTRTDAALNNDGLVGMFLLYDTFLRVDGGAIAGNDEKFAEYSSGRRGPLPGDRRSQNLLSGTVHRKYFGDSEVSIGVAEEGEGTLRASTRSYDMTISGDRMVGEFHSTVANQRGRVVCKRVIFDLRGGREEVEQRLESEINPG